MQLRMFFIEVLTPEIWFSFGRKLKIFLLPRFYVKFIIIQFLY